MEEEKLKDKVHEYLSISKRTGQLRGETGVLFYKALNLFISMLHALSLSFPTAE